MTAPTCLCLCGMCQSTSAPFAVLPLQSVAVKAVKQRGELQHGGARLLLNELSIVFASQSDPLRVSPAIPSFRSRLD